MVKSTICSSRGPGFHFEHPHDGSQPSVIPATASVEPGMRMVHRHVQAKHPDTFKKMSDVVSVGRLPPVPLVSLLSGIIGMTPSRGVGHFITKKVEFTSYVGWGMRTSLEMDEVLTPLCWH